MEQKHYDAVRLGLNMSSPEIKKQTMKRNLLRVVVLDKLNYWSENKKDCKLNITYSEILELEEKKRKFNNSLIET